MKAVCLIFALTVLLLPGCARQLPAKPGAVRTDYPPVKPGLLKTMDPPIRDFRMLDKQTGKPRVPDDLDTIEAYLNQAIEESVRAKYHIKPVKRLINLGSDRELPELISPYELRREVDIQYPERTGKWYRIIIHQRKKAGFFFNSWEFADKPKTAAVPSVRK